MPVDIAKMSAKFSKDLVSLVKEERRKIFEFLIKTHPNFVTELPDDFEYDPNGEPVEIIESFFDKNIPVSEETPKRKRASPKGTSSGTPKEAQKKPEQWIDSKIAIKMAMEALSELEENPAGIVKSVCLHVPNKGANKNKSCGIPVNMTSENKNIYSIKCPKCERINTPEKQEALRNHYNILLQGEEAVCSPTSANCARLSGNDGRTTPDETSTPSDFINGKIEGLESPSSAKPKSKKLSPNLPKVRSVIQKDEFHDTSTVEPIDGHTWFLRKTTSPLKWTVIGKIEGGVSGSELKKKVQKESYDYLSPLLELEPEEIERVNSEMNVSYEYLGKGDSKEDVSDPEPEPEEDGSDMEDLLVELAGGK